ncbi:basement membrane-specific heparan sulfate proteoglycan core protein-like [Penaeus chinensis]|uniref:basement membrane-specific heparan sulfate proteoglycan core protein-like n=1 Tax=Penaeus chinensis TaxID=139456 RepID=UPI001FB7DFD3|nr:basement membrane-specific heparan sulfate proteoglycan core protein-like [Penaeus chinensis]
MAGKLTFCCTSSLSDPDEAIRVKVLPSERRVRGAGGLPRVRWQPGTAVEEGDTVHLECQLALGVPGPAIWLKLDPRDPHSHVLLSHGEIVITDDPRFSVEHHPESNNYVVQIREVSPEDAGSYQCQVPVNSAEEELRVEAAPPVVVTLLSSASSPTPTRPARSSAAPHMPGNCPSPHAFLLFLCFLLLSNFAR